DGTNPQFLAEESTTEFLRAGVGETGNTSVIGWDDGDTLHLGVYSSPTDTGIDSLFAISGSTGNITMPGSLSADTGTVTALDLVALDTLDIAGTFTVSNLGV